VNAQSQAVTQGDYLARPWVPSSRLTTVSVSCGVARRLASGIGCESDPSGRADRASPGTPWHLPIATHPSARGWELSPSICCRSKSRDSRRRPLSGQGRHHDRRRGRLNCRNSNFAPRSSANTILKGRVMMSRISPRIITMTSTTADNMLAIYPAGDAYASCALEARTSALLCRRPVPGACLWRSVGRLVGGWQQSAGLWR
jgi:hypothetical protein